MEQGMKRCVLKEPTQEEFVTYVIRAYCSHIRAREFVSNIIDLT